MSDKKALMPSRWVWMDLEMTGLDIDQHHIIEIAVIITDTQLKEVIEGPVIAIHQPESILAGMNAWCVKTHTENGLVQRVRKSTVDLAEAEQIVLNFLKQYVKEGEAPLCGNSIWQDRRFLAKYMPVLEQYLHYRILDVSTLKILSQQWSPEVYQGVDKNAKHLALDDIRASIDELKYYREKMLR